MIDMAKNYMLRVHFKNGSSRIVPLEFDSMKKARKYAIDNMEAMPNISSFFSCERRYAALVLYPCFGLASEPRARMM